MLEVSANIVLRNGAKATSVLRQCSCMLFKSYGICCLLISQSLRGSLRILLTS
uniref:Uncharacterized protein n=1 Tax=Zea mays TaxID=4577 RepID=C0P2A6_MAIZE|nr:unknown [Zea mays]